ncbi:class I SAM-dependent methyltransferase [soil metagenome]
MNIGVLKQIVERGYDQVAENYASWAAAIYSPERSRVTNLLIDSVAQDESVLELGCGNGEPVTRELSTTLDVTAVDISREQLNRAEKAAPSATFIQSDMMALDFPERSFAAIIALYSIVHVPCEEHPAIIRRAFNWLEPGGLFVVNSAVSEAYRGYAEDWLGAPMFWSHYGPETTRRLLLDAGFEILNQRVEIINEGDAATGWVWWIARKPEEAHGR